MTRYDDQLRTLKSRMRESRLCVCPDRDVPDLICGHPLPCPHHTIIIEYEELDDFIDDLAEEMKKQERPLTSGDVPVNPCPRRGKVTS